MNTRQKTSVKSKPANAGSDSVIPIGRIPIVDVSPCLENGSWAAKGTENEPFPVQATIFREGHDAFAAQCVLVDAAGKTVQTSQMIDIAPGLSRYEGWLTPPTPGKWFFKVQAWSDPYATWKHSAEIKVNADIDINLVFLEATELFKRIKQGIPRNTEHFATIRDALKIIGKKRTPATERLAVATSPAVLAAVNTYPLQEFLTESELYPIYADRNKALFGSWYEIFPRTVGAHYDTQKQKWISGTLQTAATALPRIANMGFDVIYLTPIHPIGSTNRKGKNNTLVAQADDPGSPYAIGSIAGGHDAIHPDLGTFADFDAFVAQAKALNMEVALDLALQCSPDHPWVTAHPEWFTTRADGSIAYAENPPKKYQDIYPLNFDNDPEGIYQEIKRILELWVAHGVTIFRVDNPHTKPLTFWQRLLAYFRKKHPEVIFLAEAFTQPPMMQTLGKIGFHQSYTYFTWRNEKYEIEEYLHEISHESDSRMRPAFWPTTHDILTPYMQQGGISAFAIRAILAATAVPTWGIYSGYELVENVARDNAQEQIDNEKYEYKERDFSNEWEIGISTLIKRLNEIRQNHLALQHLRNITIHPTSNDKILCFSKVSKLNNGTLDAVLVVLNVDPYASREATIDLNLAAFNAHPNWDGNPIFEVTDELSGEIYLWGEHPYVELDPQGRVAHVLNVKVLAQQE